VTTKTKFGQIPKNIKSAQWHNASACVERRFIKRVAGGVDYATADTDIIIGVLYSNGVAEHGMVDYIPLINGEEVPVDCGAAGIAALGKVTATTAGKAVTCSGAVTKFMAGIALEAATANKVFRMLCAPGFTSG
jgi:hypothetical protein